VGGGNPLSRLIARLRAATGLENPPRDRRRALGAMGERMAVRRLRREGYRIVARNYRAAGAEIDAVAIDRDTLVFVEVKTRLTSTAGRPEDSVHGLKQNHIRRAAAVYARAHGMEDRTMRFDVVAISRQDGRWQLEIIKDAF
jgi:putative endonuclease